MVSWFLRSVGPVVLAAALLATVGCAGGKKSSSGSDYGSMENDAGSKSSKVEDARRSAEEAEMKAHRLREEKARNQGKTSSN